MRLEALEGVEKGTDTQVGTCIFYWHHSSGLRIECREQKLMQVGWLGDHPNNPGEMVSVKAIRLYPLIQLESTSGVRKIFWLIRDTAEKENQM